MAHITQPEKVSATAIAEHVDNREKLRIDDDDVHWWKQPGLRRLYLLMPFLFLGSTTLGYDGSLLNGLQAMPSWKSCEWFEGIVLDVADMDSLS